MPEPVFSLVDFFVGIVGNLCARHFDPTKDSIAAVLQQRMQSGVPHYPPNHDVERACRESLRDALWMMAQAIELKIHRPKNLLEALRNSRDSTGNRIPFLSRWKTDDSKWLDTFVNEIESDSSISSFRLQIGDAAGLNQAIRGVEDEYWNTQVKDGLLDWVERRVQLSHIPDCFKEYVELGWPLDPDTPSKRVTLYQVWCLFLQDKVKSKSEVFRILVADWLALISSGTDADSVPTTQIVDELLKPIGEFGSSLATILENINDQTKKLDSLVSNSGELLALITAFQTSFKDANQQLISLVESQTTKLSAISDGLEQVNQDRSKIERISEVVGSILELMQKLQVANVQNARSSDWNMSVCVEGEFPVFENRVNRDGFVDNEEAFMAFEHMVDPKNNNEKRILFLEGEGEHGKSEITSRFWEHSLKSLPRNSAAFVSLKPPLKSNEEIVRNVFEWLGESVPKGTKKIALTSKLLALRLAKPTVLFVDGYEHAEDEHRLWLTGSILEKISLFPLLRIVIAGRNIPVSSASWSHFSARIVCDPLLYPQAFVEYAKSIGSAMPEDEIIELCEILRRWRDTRRMSRNTTDGLSPLALIQDIKSRCVGGLV